MNLHLKDQSINQELFEEFNINIENKKHKPNQVAKLLFKKVNELHQSGKITGEQLLFINHELCSFADICGACERIKNTPIPFSYSVFLKKFIFF